MIVAVTGATGFIGQHLCAALEAKGHRVRRIVRRDFTADGRLDELLTGVDVVVHAAAATRAPSHALLRASNVDLTQRVVDAARRATVRRFVLVSSQAAAGPATSRDRPVRESDAPRPVEEYGRTKLAAERIVAANDIPFTIVRPAAVYGPGDRDFRVLFQLARRGIAIHPGNREQWISIIHVSDCVEWIIAAAVASKAAGRTYFLANDEPVQWATLFSMAASAADRRLWLDMSIPRALVHLGAAVGDVIARVTGRAGLLTTEKVALSRDPFWICSNGLARAELGLVPRTDLQQGVADLHRGHPESTRRSEIAEP